MSQPVSADRSPRLYAPKQAHHVAPISARLIALLVAIGSLGVLATAASLTPSRAGVGSHTGLGLSSCQLLDRSGVPCASCGMTTSFTWFARGNLPASFYVQPMGMMLAAAAACSVWGGAYIAVTGRPVYRLLLMFPSRSYLVGILGFAILAWGWKVFIHLRGLDGW